MMACAAGLASAQGQGLATAHPGLPVLAPRVLAQGAAASLPPNLSRVLRLGNGRERIAVRQAVLRAGKEVHVYNVLATGDHRVVLLKVDEARHRTDAYLIDSRGGLVRAVGYEGNGQAQVLGSAAAGDFEREVRFWQQYAGGVKGPAAPAPAP
jgi:hypothetical protein